ncbi:hypothetical protein BGZ57DRAFT_215426 [Hyaloscypha finlandica]|nr:hypothetical protein BGZ57DRAFT_215426 [Hyaloscypha finlandica]
MQFSSLFLVALTAATVYAQSEVILSAKNTIRAIADKRTVFHEGRKDKEHGIWGSEGYRQDYIKLHSERKGILYRQGLCNRQHKLLIDDHWRNHKVHHCWGPRIALTKRRIGHGCRTRYRVRGIHVNIWTW